MNKLLDMYNQIPEDKKGHINLGMLLGLAFGNYPLIATIVILAAGVGKEVYDYGYNKITKTNTHDADVLDALSTIFGGIVGVLITVVISISLNYIL